MSPLLNDDVAWSIACGGWHSLVIFTYFLCAGPLLCICILTQLRSPKIHIWGNIILSEILNERFIIKTFI